MICADLVVRTPRGSDNDYIWQRELHLKDLASRRGPIHVVTRLVEGERLIPARRGGNAGPICWTSPKTAQDEPIRSQI